MIAPISHKSGYTYLGSDQAMATSAPASKGSAKTPRMETDARVNGRAARPRQVEHRRYELAGWEFKPDKQGIRRKRAILRELPMRVGSNARRRWAGIEADRLLGFFLIGAPFPPQS